MDNNINTIPAVIRERIEGYKLLVADYLKTWFSFYNEDITLLPKIMADLTSFLEYKPLPLSVTDEALKIVNKAICDEKLLEGGASKDKSLNSIALYTLFNAYEETAEFIENKNKNLIDEQEAAILVENYSPLSLKFLMAKGVIELSGRKLLEVNISNYFLIFIIWVTEFNATEEDLLQLKPVGCEGLNLTEEYIRNVAKSALKTVAEIRVKREPVFIDFDNLNKTNTPTLWGEEDLLNDTLNSGNRIALKFFQSIANTLKKPMELFPTGTLDFLGGEIITLKEALRRFNQQYEGTGAEELSEEMVYYTIQGLQTIAQYRGDSYKTNIDNITWHQYKINITEFTRLSTLDFQPSAPYISKTWQSLFFLTKFNIKVEEKIYIGKDKKGMKHYKTKEVWVPFVRTSSITTYRRSEEELPYNLEIVIDIHNFIKTGKRATIVIDEGKERVIQTPPHYYTTVEEKRIAKKIFPRAEGFRFYENIVNSNHIREDRLLEYVFDYDKPKKFRANINDANYEEKIKEDEERLKKNLARNKSRHKKKLQEWFAIAQKNGILFSWERKKAVRGVGFIYEWKRNNLIEDIKINS